MSGPSSAGPTTTASEQLDAARAELVAAGERQARIDSEKAAVQQKLDEMDAARKKKGRGRPSAQNKDRYNSLVAKMKRLNEGILPGEIRPHVPAPPAQLLLSARSHAQHHAHALPVPGGGRAAGGRDGDVEGGGGDGATGGDHAARDPRARTGGATSASHGGAGGSADGGDDDDDAEDATFHGYYRVSPSQRAFNARVAAEYMRGEHKSTKIMPPNVLRMNCDPKYIGLGPCHVHAPHIFLGLPLPPCPRCGWKSVDQETLKPKGTCGARRVYADEVDEWLVGVRIICTACQDKKEKCRQDLIELTVPEPRALARRLLLV